MSLTYNFLCVMLREKKKNKVCFTYFPFAKFIMGKCELILLKIYDKTEKLIF